VFPDIQQEVLLLLGEGRNRNPQTYGRLYTRQVANGEALLSMRERPTSFRTCRSGTRMPT